VLREKALHGEPLVYHLADAVAKEDSRSRRRVIGLNEDRIDKVPTALERLMQSDHALCSTAMALADVSQNALAESEHAADAGHGEAEDLTMRRHGYSAGAIRYCSSLPSG